MNHYPHHIGDFNTATRHLSRLERDVYRDMRDMYFDTEAALDGSSFDLLARRLCCRTPEEVAALQFVLSEFFVLQEDGRYQNEECEQIIAQFHAQQSDRGQVKANENERQKRSRARRTAIFAALRSIGVVPPAKIKSGPLMALCREHRVTVTDVDVLIDGVQFDVGAAEAKPVRHGHVTVTHPPCHAAVTANQNQNHNQINTPQPPAGGPRDGLADALELQGHFPSHRRTRTAEVAALMAELVDSGAVTVVQLQAAAAKQSAELCRDGGKASPSALRWLRESRWLDSSVGQGQPASIAGGGGVPADWSATRSGVIAMGMRLGLGGWDESRDRIFATYEARVQQRLTECEQGVRSLAEAEAA